jgi:hypothetical protein
MARSTSSAWCTSTGRNSTPNEPRGGRVIPDCPPPGSNDSYIVAISACQFALEAAGEGLPHAVSAVYPFGDEFIEFNRQTLEVVRLAHGYSSHIERAGKRDDPILRTAFQDQRFADISGLIWSRRSTGNFLVALTSWPQRSCSVRTARVRAR